MRIIKEGVLPVTPEHECNCNNCNTIFTYTSEDTYSYLDYPSAYVDCPLCRQRIVVSKSIIDYIINLFK